LKVSHQAKTRLTVRGTQFTLNGKATFLCGISYYGALGASTAIIHHDLTQMQRFGFNWIRVWATWAAFRQDVSAVDGEGHARPKFLKKLRWLVAECDRRGLVVDVTLSRGNGVTGRARLQSPKAHRRAIETLVVALSPYRNWYLDLANERNIKDRRFTGFAELKELRQLVKKLDGDRLVTASHAGDINPNELREYLLTARVDFLTPHRPRHADSPGQTEARSHDYLTAMKKVGRMVPIHYQEPFRRGFDRYQPRAQDFLVDLRGSKAGSAAGWCFHNGDQRSHPKGLPRRSFDLREHSLFGQLDEEEQKTLQLLKKALR
jgi:hypothetical protein